ncbi:hypothetical protein BCR42DRAFT_381104 [Absidia repens]|uniref:RRM domain-containing protein n=1 Tax=Absidia repens TaxID=90262 RepID=A0A1X2I686_9FUNG|nr:hypothetical protein BCR42DRAFT_381104 [Absidia repens]
MINTDEPTPNLVKVTNISKDTKEATLRDFFAFCGKIKDFELESDGDHQKALILFESPKAAKTAELLSNALVEDSHIQVDAYFQNTPSLDEKRGATPAEAAAAATADTSGSSEEKTEGGDHQNKKTVSNIMAELLSSGYVLGDQVLAKGIEFDHKFGVKDTVQHYYDQIRQNLHQWNEQYHVSDKASEMEQKMGLQQKQKEASDMAQNWLHNSPTGQKVSGLISQFSQQISDLNNEAKRLASVRQNEAQSNSGAS